MISLALGNISSKKLLLDRGELLLPLVALGSGNPSALHMGLAIEATALAACPAPHVRAILLRLVPTVLAANPTCSTCCSAPHGRRRHQEGRSRG
ncbi:hypothetical protein AHAS_Ahas05G0047500 [Arachis hypogaea]